MSIGFAIGVAQGLLLILFLLLKRENRKANTLLALAIFLISFSLFLNYCYESELILLIPHLIGLDNANPFLIPPIFYFYTRALTEKDFQFKKMDILHLLPFVIYFIYVLLNFFTEDAAYKLEFLENLRTVGVPTDLLVSSVLKIVQAMIYLLMMYSLLKMHSKSIKNEFSYIEKINLSWLRVIIISFAVIYAIRLIGIFINIISTEFTPGFIEGIMELINVLFIFVMAYFGLSQPQIFKERNIEAKENIKPNDKLRSPNFQTKYATSILKDEQSQIILNDLLAHMKSEKPYLKSGITIKEIADALDVHPKSLSQVINEQLNLNFFNFINQYRVEEVKSKLKDSDYAHFSILGIAMDCGFSSKSSFNSIFKKFTGSTPTSYKSTTS